MHTSRKGFKHPPLHVGGTNGPQDVAGWSQDYLLSQRKAYKLAMSGKSRKAAMKCMCLQCVGFMRSEVIRCTSHSCPLYPYRPYVQGKGGAS